MTTEFRPDWISAPGDTIQDLLEERRWTIHDLADRLNQTADRTKALIDGRTTITIQTAKRLSQTLGSTAEFWMARDAQYRQAATRLYPGGQEWLDELPISDIVRFGWIDPPPKPSEEVPSLLKFFNVCSVAEWRNTYGALQSQVAFRTSGRFDSSPGSVAAWLRQGERQAAAIPCAKWDRGRFEGQLAKVRNLTRAKQPCEFLPALTDLCAEAGVAAVVVRSPRGCRASGATRFLSPSQAMLLLSFRYLSDDHFWFTFFHEAAHLLLHPIEALHLEGLGESATALEMEANDYAACTLIPDEFKASLYSVSKHDKAIVRLARDIGVSPGIVVGQMQHRGIVGMNQFNYLKRHYEWA